MFVWYWITLILVGILKDSYASYHEVLDHKLGFQTWEHRYVIMELGLFGRIGIRSPYFLLEF